MRTLCTALLILATSAAFAEPGRYTAQDTLRAAAIGTYSARLAPPVRVKEVRGVRTSNNLPATFDRLECRVDNYNQLICQQRRTTP